MANDFAIARGRVAATLLLVALTVALSACSGGSGSSQAPSGKAAPTAAKPATMASTAAAMKPADHLQTMSVDQLMNAAQKALKEDRLVAPAGDNAFDYYLEVLKKSPNNRAAQDALRETFPYGAQTVDQTINQKDFAEAQREINLLASADPTNYTLTILRSKLDAARKVATQQQAAQQQAQQASAAEKARLAAAASVLKQQQAQAALVRQQQDQAAALKQQQAQAAAQKQQAVALKQQQAQQTTQSLNREAQIVRQVPPQYPLSAARDGEQGWVDVEFTVSADGSVTNAHVTDAQPRRVFDRAALEAVNRWQFKPALINGIPTAVVLKRRVEFKLSGNG
ncbi:MULTISPECIES: energy transducer TonB [Metallibacterium]|jgi:protein TonB|uniref:energy transducer TonB n=1 Tax=Metallibacterium TaxID=1218803 RepID=UPI002614D7C3|nr:MULTISPECIES: energy transducer TonB [Metallibacterium]MBW8074345.1 TonB family protein [Metallibacterium scheffleri]